MCDTVLELLNLQDEDAVLFLYETRRHPKVCEYLLSEPPKDIESHKKWLHKNVPSKRLMFILRCDGKAAGYCHVYDFDNAFGTMEVGFVMHPDYQGRGLGKIMIQKFLEKLFEIMPDRVVQLCVQDSNGRAIGLYLKCGFKMVSCMDGVIVMERRNDCGKQNQEDGFCL